MLVSRLAELYEEKVVDLQVCRLLLELGRVMYMLL